MNWDQVTHEAEKYVQPLQTTVECSRYLDEIKGLAAGAGVSVLDVLALNVRTEIMFGLFTDETTGNNTHKNNKDIPSDGCTSLGWFDARLPGRPSFLAQNWDWQKAQGPHLIICHVSPGELGSNDETSSPSHAPPKFVMVTEAGIIGKIGFNAHGVGCCLNAIRARGVDPHRRALPVHLALRAVLESRSRADAVARLHESGLAGSAHILVADAETGPMGLECSPVSGIKEMAMDGQGRVCHTNHLLLAHPGVDEPPWLADSRPRLARIQALAARASLSSAAGPEGAVVEDFGPLLMDMLKNEEGFPCSINRKEEGESTFETLFTIVMNLSRREARVKFGRPTEGGPEVTLTL